MSNPLFKETATPRGWSPLNSGYAIDEMIPENLTLASTGTVPAHTELLTVSVPLAAIADPGRTPLIAPCDNFFFRYDEAQLNEFNGGTLKILISIYYYGSDSGIHAWVVWTNCNLEACRIIDSLNDSSGLTDGKEFPSQAADCRVTETGRCQSRAQRHRRRCDVV